MDFDALSAGVEPGGLRNRMEIKLLVCYILNSVMTPLTKDQVCNIICTDGLANYFEIGQAISELLQQGNIIELEGQGLMISDTGSTIASTLETSLPFTVREKAVKTTIRTLSKIRREQENKVTIEKSKTGFIVSLGIWEKDLELLTVRILMPDRLQGETVKEQFLNDPTGTYQRVLEKLKGEEIG